MDQEPGAVSCASVALWDAIVGTASKWPGGGIKVGMFPLILTVLGIITRGAIIPKDC